jgi:hypothetical protein
MEQATLYARYLGSQVYTTQGFGTLYGVDAAGSEVLYTVVLSANQEPVLLRGSDLRLVLRPLESLEEDQVKVIAGMAVGSDLSWTVQRYSATCLIAISKERLVLIWHERMLSVNVHLAKEGQPIVETRNIANIVATLADWSFDLYGALASGLALTSEHAQKLVGNWLQPDGSLQRNDQSPQLYGVHNGQCKVIPIQLGVKETAIDPDQI